MQLSCSENKIGEGGGAIRPAWRSEISHFQVYTQDGLIFSFRKKKSFKVSYNSYIFFHLPTPSAPTPPLLWSGGSFWTFFFWLVLKKNTIYLSLSKVTDVISSLIGYIPIKANDCLVHPVQVSVSKPGSSVPKQKPHWKSKPARLIKQSRFAWNYIIIWHQLHDPGFCLEPPDREPVCRWDQPKGKLKNIYIYIRV